jgi:hypothetical protein
MGRRHRGMAGVFGDKNKIRQANLTDFIWGLGIGFVLKTYLKNKKVIQLGVNHSGKCSRSVLWRNLIKIKGLLHFLSKKWVFSAIPTGEQLFPKTTEKTKF